MAWTRLMRAGDACAGEIPPGHRANGLRVAVESEILLVACERVPNDDVKP